MVMDVTAFYSFHLNLSAFASPFFIVPWVERNGWALSFGLQGAIVAGSTIIVVPALQIMSRRLLKARESLHSEPSIEKSA